MNQSSGWSECLKLARPPQDWDPCSNWPSLRELTPCGLRQLGKPFWRRWNQSGDLTDGRSPKQEEQTGAAFQQQDWSEETQRNGAECVANAAPGRDWQWECGI